MKGFFFALGLMFYSAVVIAEDTKTGISQHHYIYTLTSHESADLRPTSTNLHISADNLIAFNSALFSRNPTFKKIHFDQKYANWLPTHELSVAVPEPRTWMFLGSCLMFAFILALKGQRKTI